MKNEMSLPELEIVYEDNHLLAVVKPAGILAQGDETGDDSIVDRTREWIRIKYQKPGNVYCGLIHRLDRPASGVMLLAKTSKAASRLSDQFRRRDVRKVYRVAVEGRPSRDQGELTDFLGRDRQRRLTTVVSADTRDAKKAILTYTVLRTTAECTELEVILETGRKHQIRAQMANQGCPVIGDLKYGAAAKLKDGRAIALHALSLTVTHPTKREPITVTAPLPEYWPL